MGGRNSREKRVRNTVLDGFADTFERLGMTRNEGARLLKAFQRIDADKSGQITLTELIMFLDVERTKFTMRAFRMFDQDGSGEINFAEFVATVYNFCAMSKSSLIRFSFELFDLDGSGTLELDELQELLKEVWGKGFKSNYHAQQSFEKASKCANAMGQVTKAAYVQFANRHISILFPAFSLQRSMQSKIGGSKFWQGMADRRSARFSNADSLRNFLDNIKDTAELEGVLDRAYGEPEPETPTIDRVKQVAVVRQRRASVSGPPAGFSRKKARRASVSAGGRRGRRKSVDQQLAAHLAAASRGSGGGRDEAKSDDEDEPIRSRPRRRSVTRRNRRRSVDLGSLSRPNGALTIPRNGAKRLAPLMTPIKATSSAPSGDSRGRRRKPRVHGDSSDKRKQRRRSSTTRRPKTAAASVDVDSRVEMPPATASPNTAVAAVFDARKASRKARARRSSLK